MAFELPTKNVIAKEKPNKHSKINKIVAIMSGKGGVGKSSVTALTAVALRDNGYNVGILDADITGPSIPKIFGLDGKKSTYSEMGIKPMDSALKGIKVISINLLLEDEEAPVIWRAPLITQTIKQFFTEVEWGELDYLLIDLPPGTGDVPLTIMQSFPLNGIIVVSSPQDLVRLIVKKSVNMSNTMKVPVLGLVENMSYFKCPDNGKNYNIFGEGKVKSVAEEMGLELLGKLPIDPELAKLSDDGKIEEYTTVNEEFNEIFGNKIVEIIGGLK
ncbi:MAG: Mrp/NBP35 family ATP-binding protein [Clostridiales bacterium]|nr:Mrp/NBP35 family ATP-binding protein [Clostridiales bacterium]